jgi:hypothetical protein
VTTGGSGERAFARGALHGALLAIVCALVAFGAMIVNEATTKSYGVLAPEHVREQSLLVSVPLVGWQLFSAWAVLARLGRGGGRRAFALRSWFTIAAAPFALFALFVVVFVKGWGPPSEGEIVSRHALVAYFVADLFASMFILAGALVGRRMPLAS